MTTPPAPTLAPGRVSVDGAMMAKLDALCRASRDWSQHAWRDAAVDVVLDARPLPAAPVAAMTEAEARRMLEDVTVPTFVRGQLGERGGSYVVMDATEEAARARLIAALTATPAAHAPDRAAVERAVDAHAEAAEDAERLARAPNMFADFQAARDRQARKRAALLALVFPAAPAHDADAAGEAVRDV